MTIAATSFGELSFRILFSHFGRVSRVEGLQKGCKVLVFVAKAGLEESPVRAASRMRTSRFTLTSQVPTI